MFLVSFKFSRVPPCNMLAEIPSLYVLEENYRQYFSFSARYLVFVRFPCLNWVNIIYLSQQIKMVATRGCSYQVAIDTINKTFTSLFKVSRNLSTRSWVTPGCSAKLGYRSVPCHNSCSGIFGVESGYITLLFPLHFLLRPSPPSNLTYHEQPSLLWSITPTDLLDTCVWGKNDDRWVSLEFPHVERSFATFDSLCLKINCTATRAKSWNRKSIESADIFSSTVETFLTSEWCHAVSRLTSFFCSKYSLKWRTNTVSCNSFLRKWQSVK